MGGREDVHVDVAHADGALEEDVAEFVIGGGADVGEMVGDRVGAEEVQGEEHEHEQKEVEGRDQEVDDEVLGGGHVEGGGGD